MRWWSKVVWTTCFVIGLAQRPESAWCEKVLVFYIQNKNIYIWKLYKFFLCWTRSLWFDVSETKVKNMLMCEHIPRIIHRFTEHTWTTHTLTLTLSWTAYVTHSTHRRRSKKNYIPYIRKIYLYSREIMLIIQYMNKCKCETCSRHTHSHSQIDH